MPLTNRSDALLAAGTKLLSYIRTYLQTDNEATRNKIDGEKKIERERFECKRFFKMISERERVRRERESEERDRERERE